MDAAKRLTRPGATFLDGCKDLVCELTIDGTDPDEIQLRVSLEPRLTLDVTAVTARAIMAATMKA